MAETVEVVEKHRFDEANLAAYMAANVEGFEGPLEISQFAGGQSNPTYKLDTPKRSYVLRRKPPGKLLPSASRGRSGVPGYCRSESNRLSGTARVLSL